ncbi:MAG: hypothetical protein J1F41_06670 [Lachnospiraceae bacterium]|nr:hypothetical protein [Lachnospiraceae bacterium]
MKMNRIRKNYQNAVAIVKKCEIRLFEALNRISVKRMTIYAAILFVISVTPLLLLGRYNVMCIDDYDYGRRIHDVWISTGSPWLAVKAAVGQMTELYMHQQGTYVSCILMGLCPMNFRYETAFLVPVLMVGMFSMATFILGRHVLVRWLGSDKHQASLVMFLLLFMYYQVMEAPFEGVYWYNGAVHYILMESVLFLVVTLVSENALTRRKKAAAFWCFLACVGGVFVGGGNLVTGLQAEIVLFFLLLYTYVMHREKILYVLFPFLTFTSGFLCNVLAPGNTVKTKTLEAGLDMKLGYSFIPAVCLSFYYAAVFIIEWTNVLVILVWLALLPIFRRIGKQSDRNFEHPVWISVGAFCLVSAMFTPTLFALGEAGLARVDNIIQMVYYLSLFFVTIYWFGWICSDSDKSELKQPAGKQFGIFLESTGNIMTVMCMLLVLVIWILTANKNTYTGISALRSLIKGDAGIYYTEAMERHELYVDKTLSDVIVEPFSAKPALFDFEDLSEEEGNWLNQAVAAYYHKSSVKRR